MSYAEGIKKSKEGDLEGAFDQFTLAVEKDPSDSKSWNALGVTLSKLNNKALALQSLKTAVKLNPNNELYQRNLNKLLTPQKSIVDSQKSNKKHHIESQLKRLKTQEHKKTHPFESDDNNDKSDVIKKIIENVFSGILFIIQGIIGLIIVLALGFIVGSVVTGGANIINSLLNHNSFESDSSSNWKDQSKSQIGHISINYPYKWQGVISTGSSTYSINGFGGKSKDVNTNTGILSANVQKMDGSQEKIKLCIEGECQTSSAPYGVVSLATNIKNY